MSTVTKANRDIKSLQPVAQQAAKLFLEECKKQGVDIFVTEYHRSQERQNYLYEQGRSRPGKIVTQTKTSNHTSGYAWDIAVNPPNELYDFNIIAKAGDVARQLGIDWGGNWTDFRDTPHFQVAKGWKAPSKQRDEELEKAVEKLVLKGVMGNPSVWNRMDRINLKNVPALLSKMGGIDKLVKDNVISNRTLWDSGKYSVDHVRSLIIKYASRG